MDVLQKEQTALDRFIDILQQEQSALVAADVDALQSLSADKQHLSEQLNNLSQQRAALLQRAGFTADTEGVKTWLATQPAEVRQAWEKLLASAQTAQRLNQTNGKLIQPHLQPNPQALTALMGAANRAEV